MTDNKTKLEATKAPVDEQITKLENELTTLNIYYGELKVDYDNSVDKGATLATQNESLATQLALAESKFRELNAGKQEWADNPLKGQITRLEKDNRCLQEEQKDLQEKLKSAIDQEKETTLALAPTLSKKNELENKLTLARKKITQLDEKLTDLTQEYNKLATSAGTLSQENATLHSLLATATNRNEADEYQAVGHENQELHRQLTDLQDKYDDLVIFHNI